MVAGVRMAWHDGPAMATTCRITPSWCI